MPTLALGKPPDDKGLATVEVAGVTIHYHPDLQVKPGHEAIEVRLRSFLFLRWLELEGARSTPVYEGE